MTKQLKGIKLSRVDLFPKLNLMLNMNKFSIAKNPIFIPKITQGETLFVNSSFSPVFLMDGHIVAFFHKPAINVSKKCKILIIDPVTNYLIFKHYKRKKSFKKLPYSPKDPFKVEDLLIDENLRMNGLVKPVIDYQTNNNAGIIILPYLFTESATNVKFGLNLTLISDSLKYLSNKKIKKPVFAMINIGSSVLEDPKTLNFIIERYDDDFGENIKGYFIMLDKFDDREANKDSLTGLAYLAFQLSRKKDVFVLRIGSFGEILSAIGASGFSSGLFGGETFSEESLRKELGGYGRSPTKWTYIPEFFNYLNVDEIKRINYKCSCPACRGLIAKGFNSKKEHYLYNRASNMKKLSNLTRDKRISLMKFRLENGIQLATSCNNKYTVSIKTKHLKKWYDVLDSAKNFAYRDEQKKKEVNLDKMIHEARAKKKK